MNFHVRNSFMQHLILFLKNFHIQKLNLKIELNNLMMNFLVIQIKYYGKNQIKKNSNKKKKNRKNKKKKKKIQKIF